MRRRDAVFYLKNTYHVSERRACATTGQARSTQRLLPPKQDKNKVLLQRIEALVRENPRAGYRTITDMLKLEGWHVNLKRVHRLWKQEGYRVPIAKKKPRHSGSSANACHKIKAQAPNDVWTYDFIFDRLENGRALKILAVTDEYTRESLAIVVGNSLGSADVVLALNDIAKRRGFPRYLRSDNGSEFVSEAVKRWFAASGTEGLYVEKGSPWQNGFAEAFNSRFREECLNMNLFYSVSEAHEIIKDWQWRYNERRPHSSLKGLPPTEFARRYQALSQSL